MSRPIPEGVVAPEGCMILGFGDEFELPEKETFHGWIHIPSRTKPNEWFEHRFILLVNSNWLYAADRDSEVARLNRLAKFERDLEAVIAVDPQAAKEEFRAILDRRKKRDKDALIRELVGALDRADHALKLSGHHKSSDAREDIQRTLTLARTTCPEAFE